MKFFSGKLMQSKKGGMELSINTIVILILAITMLGLGLTFVRGMMQKSVGKIGGAIEATQLETQPDAGNPITVPDQINIVQGKTYQTQIGFFNKYGCKYTKVKIQTGTVAGEIECIKAGETAVKKMSVTAPELSAVEPGGIGGYRVIFDPKKLGTIVPGDTFICTIGIIGTKEGACTGAPDGTAPDKYIETKSFFLTITS